MSDFSHIKKDGMPGMVNVGDKQITKRSATARTEMFLGKDIVSRFQDGELNTKKGAVFQTAIIAGTMAVKQTSNLIPLCHPLPINGIDFEMKIIDEGSIEILCTVEISGKTGVEMEALTGASLAALTVYDMCKAFGHHMIIRETRLLKKTGGKSDFNTVSTQ